MPGQSIIDTKEDGKLKGSIPDDTPTDSALRDAVWMLRLVTSDRRWRHPRPSMDAVALTHIARHIMPPKAASSFNTWLGWASKAMLQLAPAPTSPWRPQTNSRAERHTTRPAAPTSATPSRSRPSIRASATSPEMRKDLLARFLSRLDWKMKPFLRSPEEMKKLGFLGRPINWSEDAGPKRALVLSAAGDGRDSPRSRSPRAVF